MAADPGRACAFPTRGQGPGIAETADPVADAWPPAPSKVFRSAARLGVSQPRPAGSGWAVAAVGGR
jgi:hypothetical protein